jgi:hypothetical protein
MDHLLMDIHPIRDIHQVVVIDIPILEPSMDRHIIHHLAALDVEEDVVGPIFTQSTHHRRRVIVVHIIILRQ